MTELRQVSMNNYGLFSTRAYTTGDVILDEDVLFTFGPTSPEQDLLLQSQLDMLASDGSKRNVKKTNKKGYDLKKKSPSMDDIEVPNTVESKYAGKFRGMVLAGLSFVLFTSNDDTNRIKDRLLNLYAPSLTSPCTDIEKSIVDVAMQAKDYCKKHACTGSQLQIFFQAPDSAQREQDLVRAMLVWTCNAFDGGLLYDQTSRINHSCDPNAIIQVDNENQQQRRQKVLATVNISAGDEICISYLGIFTYCGGAARLARLKHTKHFVCNCNRCQSFDFASAIPCPSCHPRTFNNKYLEEDVQYDDDQSVHYAYPKNAHNATTSARCEHCKEATTSTTGGTMKIGNKVAEKVATHILSQQLLTSKHKAPSKDQNDIQSEIDEQLFQLSSSVLGSRHWCTNFMTLILLNRQLNALNSAMILTNEAPDLTEVAECIDSLERLWIFLTSLKLQMHPSHLLAGPTIGVARVLISLGDEKSQTYGAEWANRVEEYIRQGFEGQSMIKVLDAIKGAQTKNSSWNIYNENKYNAMGDEDNGFFEKNGNKMKRVKKA